MGHFLVKLDFLRKMCGNFFLENAEEENRRRVFPFASVFISSAMFAGIRNLSCLSSFSDEEAGLRRSSANKSIRKADASLREEKNLRIRFSEEGG